MGAHLQIAARRQRVLYAIFQIVSHAKSVDQFLFCIVLDQVICANANNRTDEFGGSMENRSRFILKVSMNTPSFETVGAILKINHVSTQLITSVTDAIGQEKTAIRLSPFSAFQNVLSTGHNRRI